MELASRDELAAALAEIREAPSDGGTVALIVRRPEIGSREIVTAADLDADVGVVGDNWRVKGSSRTPDGASDPDKQITVMNVRAARAVAVERERVALAGDQIYVDLDISHENLPAGTRLAIGSAVIEITDAPHLGCHKFAARFGRDALQFVNSATGRALRLRGANARVVHPGTIATGDVVRKVVPAVAP